MTHAINLTLKIWRQKGTATTGKLETIEASDISTDMSFLEMLDVVNERLTLEGKQPIAFDYDCREGICGQCGCVSNGRTHGPEKATTLCQLHMRHFADGDTIVRDSWRSKTLDFSNTQLVDITEVDAGSGNDTIIGAAGDDELIADLHARNQKTLLRRLFQTSTKWCLGLTWPLVIIIITCSSRADSRDNGVPASERTNEDNVSLRAISLEM